MAVASPPPFDQAIARVKQEVQEHLAGVLDAKPGDEPPRVEIGEGFELWRVGIVRPDEDKTLRDLATPLHQYHHQIYVNDAPAALAWSQRETSGEWAVPTIARTWLPAAIDQAIDVIDASQDVPQRAVTRLLRAAAYGVWSFWFVSPDDEPLEELIYTIAAPRNRVHVRAGLLMPAHAFVRELGKERPTDGVPPQLPA